MEGRPQADVPRQRAAFVDECRMLVKNRGDARGIAAPGGQEQRGQRRLGGAAASGGACERDPTLEPALARQRVLDVAQRGSFGRSRVRTVQPCARLRIAGPE
jgi:hypothetical protein